MVGGSSGGEGAILAASGVPFGIGSDVAGSIRMPAFFNGIFGHKPSALLVSNIGQYPPVYSIEENSFLTIGPMCRYAGDLELLLKIIANDDIKKVNFEKPVDVNKIKVYYQEDDTGSACVSEVGEEIKGLFKKINHHLDESLKNPAQKLELVEFKQSFDIWFMNMMSNGPPFDEQLTDFKGKINAIQELVKSLFGKSKYTVISLLTCLVYTFGPQYQSHYYYKMVAERDLFKKKLNEILGQNGVLIYPTHPTAALYHNEPIFRFFNFGYTGVINTLKLPSTHIPMGLNKEGLPIGVQVIANDKCDHLCLAVARELEKHSGGWVNPNKRL